MKAYRHFAAALVCSVAFCSRPSLGQYTLKVLHPVGYDQSVLTGSSGGVSGGYARVNPEASHAVLWPTPNAAVIDLNPDSYAGSAIYGVTDGQQVGAAWQTEGARAGIWSGTASSFVSLHATRYVGTEALGTSGAQQVGSGYVPRGLTHALLWAGTPESLIDLNPTGYETSRAFAVAAGQQVGEANGHAMIWHGSAASAVDIHPSGYGASRLVATTGSRQLGFATYQPNPSTPETRIHAMLWSGSAEGVVDLHADGYKHSYAWGMSEAQQVGHGELADGSTHALLWSGTRESVVDLHSFVPREFTASGAIAVDAMGNIYGAVVGLEGDSVLGYPAVWLVPEPTALGLLVPGLALLLRRRTAPASA